MLADTLFLSVALNKRTITLPDGTEHALLFKEAGSGVFRAYWRADADADAQDLAAARLIAASLVNEDGSPAITVERAAQLKPAVSGQIVAAILEVNGFLKQQPKPGQPEAEPGNA